MKLINKQNISKVFYSLVLIFMFVLIIVLSTADISLEEVTDHNTNILSANFTGAEITGSTDGFIGTATYADKISVKPYDESVLGLRGQYLDILLNDVSLYTNDESFYTVTFNVSATAHDNFDSNLFIASPGDKYLIYNFSLPEHQSYDFVVYKNSRTKENLIYSTDEANEFWFQLDSLDETRPAINGQENFVMSVDEEKDIQFFINFFKALDDIDGDITDQIYIITDNFTVNKRVLGKHDVTIGVKDLSDNESTLKFFINIVDIGSPVLVGNNTIVRIGYKDSYDLEAFRKTLTVSDNYDTMSLADIKIKTDNYTTNKNKLGTYNVVFEATDKSGNVGTFTKPIQVYDNVSPVFSGTSSLTKSYTTHLTVADILKDVSANDEIDGNLTGKILIVADTFTGKANKVGNYELKLSVKDNAGNISYRTIPIKVTDDQLPNWWITNGVTINLTADATLTRTQIVEVLKNSGQVVASSNARVSYTIDTYTDNIGKAGLYTLAFTVSNTNGVENSYTYGVNVLSEDLSDVEVLPNLTFYETNKKVIWTSAIVLIAVTSIVVIIKKRK